MNISWTADHLAYLPSIGLIGVVAAALQAASAAAPTSSRTDLSAVVFALFFFLGWRSHQYATVFKDEVTLWKYAAAQTPDSWQVQANLAATLIHANAPDEALEHAGIAVQLRPDHPASYTGLGDALSLVPGRLPDALAAYEKALALEPDYPMARLSYGSTLEKAGRTAEAMAQYREAIQEDPTDARAHIDLADALAKDPARRPEAVENYRAALQLLPDDAATHMDLADTLATLPGHSAEAEAEFRAAHSLMPSNADIPNDYGGMLARQPGRLADAVAEFQQAVQLRPNFIAAHYNLGLVLLQTDRPGEAAGEFETVLRLQPNHLGAHYYLAVALSQIPGRANEAIPLLQAVLQARPDFVPAQALLTKLQASQ
jgi:tetratricopeptide (TPR) repeat protein